jgi:hypothetical protein
MASIAGANSAYFAYRNALAGKTSDYTISSVMTNFATTLFAFFSDDATVDPLDSHVFQTSYGASDNPEFAATAAGNFVLTSVTSGTVGTGVVDFADSVFTGASVLTGSTSVESLIVGKFITNAAASPVMIHYGSATGLPLTPNGADVTVVWNASGAYSI